MVRRDRLLGPVNWPCCVHVPRNRALGWRTISYVVRLDRDGVLRGRPRSNSSAIRRARWGIPDGRLDVDSVAVGVAESGSPPRLTLPFAFASLIVFPTCRFLPTVRPQLAARLARRKSNLALWHTKLL